MKSLETRDELISIGMPIHTILNFVCSLFILIIVISTFIHFKNDDVIAKPIKIVVLLCFITAFLCIFIRGITWSVLYQLNVNINCNAVKLFWPILYLLQKGLYYEFLIIRLETTFNNTSSDLDIQKRLFNEKIWCLRAYNYTGYVFFTFWSLISTNVDNNPYTHNIWGIWCEEHYSKAFIIPYCVSDAIYSIIILLMYINGLKSLIYLLNVYNIDKHNLDNPNSVDKATQDLKDSIVDIAKAQTILCSIGVTTTMIFFGIANVFIKPLSWFNNLDLLINCLCIYLMLSFVKLTKRIKIGGIFCWCWCCWPFNKMCWNNKLRSEMNKVFNGSQIESSIDDDNPKALTLDVVSDTSNL